MRLLIASLSLSPSLLLWAFVILSIVEANVPHQTPHTSHASNGKPWLSRVRDNLVAAIWSIPSASHPGLPDSTVPPRANPPLKLLARYGGDLVLRFKFESPEEAEALTEAIKILFLDVWEFTAEWVDIRLSKDIVSRETITLKSIF